MLSRLIGHLHSHSVAYVALVSALAGGGGYAIAATGGSKQIKGCIDNRTKLVHIGGNCHRGQHRLIWNQQGLQGIQGIQGIQGPPAAQAWASVNPDGTIDGGRNISVQHTGTGQYAVHVVNGVCPGSAAPVASANGVPGSLAVATISGTSANFGVFIATVPGGTLIDDSFNVVVAC